MRLAMQVLKTDVVIVGATVVNWPPIIEGAVVIA
jgi:hypothetical protein